MGADTYVFAICRPYATGVHATLEGWTTAMHIHAAPPTHERGNKSGLRSHRIGIDALLPIERLLPFATEQRDLRERQVRQHAAAKIETITDFSSGKSYGAQWNDMRTVAEIYAQNKSIGIIYRATQVIGGKPRWFIVGDTSNKGHLLVNTAINTLHKMKGV